MPKIKKLFSPLASFFFNVTKQQAAVAQPPPVVPSSAQQQRRYMYHSGKHLAGCQLMCSDGHHQPLLLWPDSTPTPLLCCTAAPLLSSHSRGTLSTLPRWQTCHLLLWITSRKNCQNGCEALWDEALTAWCQHFGLHLWVISCGLSDGCTNRMNPALSSAKKAGD